MNIHLYPELFNSSFISYINDYQHKFFVLVGGAGSGKSVAAMQKLIIKSVNIPNLRTLIIRSTFASIKQSCWKLILSILTEWKIYKYCDINKSSFTITFPNGSEILFAGAQDIERLKSATSINDAIVEEASEISGDDYDQIVLRVRGLGKYENQITLLSNPTSKASYIYKRWFAPGVEISPDTVIHRSTYKDNKFLPLSYIESLNNLKKTNYAFFRIYAEGEWTSLDKLIFNGNWFVQDFTLNDIKNLKHCVGMDLGFVVDPSTIVDSYVDVDNKIIYIYRTWGAAGKTNDELARIITDLGLAKSDIICDSAEPKSIVEMKRAGIQRIRGAKKGPDSVRYGIQRLLQYRIYVRPCCTNIITEFENYAWKKDPKSGEYLNEPVDQFNHSIDGLRYSLEILDKPTLQTFDKKLLF